MHLIKGQTFAEVYKQALDLVVNNPDYVCKPRDYSINECLNVSLEIEDIRQNLIINEVRSTPLKYLKDEFVLYLSKTNLADRFCKASKFWNRVKNDDGTVNSAYGNLIFKCNLANGWAQFDWAYNALANDPDSRQAVMFYNRPEFQQDGTHDFVCTLYNIFHIRNNKLYMTANMRSNDAIRGITFDMPWFSFVQWLMYKTLKQNKYPDLELGSLTYIANSFHLYHDLVKDSDVDLAKKMLQHSFKSDSIPFPEDPYLFVTSPMVEDFAECKFKDLPFDAKLVNEDDQKFFEWLNDSK